MRSRIYLCVYNKKSQAKWSNNFLCLRVSLFFLSFLGGDNPSLSLHYEGCESQDTSIFVFVRRLFQDLFAITLLEFWNHFCDIHHPNEITFVSSIWILHVESHVDTVEDFTNSTYVLQTDTDFFVGRFLYTSIFHTVASFSITCYVGHFFQIHVLFLWYIFRIHKFRRYTTLLGTCTCTSSVFENKCKHWYA